MAIHKVVTQVAADTAFSIRIEHGRVVVYNGDGSTAITARTDVAEKLCTALTAALIEYQEARR